MAADELSQTLRTLHDELAGNPELDENTTRSLRALLGEIQAVLDRGTEGEPHVDTSREPSRPVGERLRSVIGEFEGRHPTLTLSLSQIADGLTAMGI